MVVKVHTMPVWAVAEIGFVVVENGCRVEL